MGKVYMSGGGGSAISTTKAAFLNLVANSQLVPSATYKITDIFEGDRKSVV